MVQSIILPNQSRLIRDSLLVLIGIIFLSLSAQLVIPLQPVPLTFQSAMVVMLGMLYGSRLGAFSVLGYLILGGIGLPLFAGLSGGLGVFTGATAGYLFGFLPAAIVGGFLAEKGFAKNILSAFLSAILSVSIIFFFGLLVLAKFVGWQHAFDFGLAPFVVTEPLKLLVVALVVPRCWKATK